MGRAEVQAMVTGAGLPCAHLAFPAQAAPELPWAVFYLEEEASLNADGKRYATVSRWTLELYQRASSTETENALESAIQQAFGPYDKSEAWVESENCIQTTYQFTEIERIDNGQG